MESFQTDDIQSHRHAAQPPGPAANEPAPRGMTGLAWVLIVLISVLMVVVHATDLRKPAKPSQANDENPIEAMLLELQGKYIVGASQFTPQDAMLIESMERAMNVGSIKQRQKFIVLVGELQGPEKALERLDALDSLIESQQVLREDQQSILSADAQRLQQELRRLYQQRRTLNSEIIGPPDADAAGVESHEQPLPAADADGSTAEPIDETLVVDQLGWYGELAAAVQLPSDAPQRVRVMEAATAIFVFIIVIAVVGGLAGFAGFAGLIAVVVMLIVGKLRAALTPPGNHHGIYAETFAVWMVLFLGLQILAAWVSSFAPNMALPIVFMAFMTSLLALIWPTMRGLSWAQIRRDIGWHGGRSTLLEIGVGAGSYFLALPLLAVGIALTYVLLILQQAFRSPGPMFEPPGGPAHPIIEQLSGPDWFPKIMVLALGAISAPIVEETMFRGVLYGQLRGGTRAWGNGLSIAFSTIVNSFIFAAIHPQGWVAIPALMSLAVAFSLVREWRGSIIPPMVMHGMSNFIVLSLLITALSL